MMKLTKVLWFCALFPPVWCALLAALAAAFSNEAIIDILEYAVQRLSG